jgi:histidinol-phosphate aminotransferase
MLPFSVNSIAQAAAVASLAAEDELFERVEHTVKERTRVREALIADGWAVPPTEANFVWLALGEHTLDFAAACFDEGIAIRPFAGDGARVSIGDTEANDAETPSPNQQGGTGPGYRARPRPLPTAC